MKTGFLKKYAFPDYDPDTQLIAISTIIISLTKTLEEKEKSFDKTDYSKLNPAYSGDLYADDLCNLSFLDVAVSHSMVAVIAPFLESLFRHEIAALHDNGFKGKPEHPRTNKKEFWKIEFMLDSTGETKKKIAEGIYQTLEALDLLKFFPNDIKEMLEIIFWYRNYALHNSFEAKIEQRNKSKREIEENGWEKYFSWVTSDGNPRMVSMEKDFMLKCFDFCIEVKKGFDRQKGIDV